MPDSTLDHFLWSFGRLLQGKKQYPSRDSCEREEHAQRAEKRGDKEQAAFYRACLCRSEWHALGYEGEFGNYRKVRKGVSMYEATNGALGWKQDFAPLRNLREDRISLRAELSKASGRMRETIRREIEEIDKEIEQLEAARRAAE